MSEHAGHLALTDTKQNVWQLSVIQLCGWTSLPVLATSILILEDNTFYGAALTLIVGNAILWFIRLAIVGMSYKRRQSTLDLSREYLGNTGSIFIGAILLITTLVWFIAQTTAASTTLTHLITINESPSIDQFTQMSVLLGVVSTFLCMEGIVVLRKLSTISFPILLVVFFTALFTMPFHIPQDGVATLSLSGLTLVLSTNLGITSDLPTFFRHSKSLATSITALTVVQVISLILALCSLYLGTIVTDTFQVNESAVLGTGNELLRVSLVIFVFVSVICANVANVYSASVGWEVIAPKALVGRKEYLILGLGLTTIFIMVSNLFSLDALLDISDNSLVNLCIIFIVGYFISRLKRRAANVFEQCTYFIAWSLSTFVNALQRLEITSTLISPFVTAILITLTTILCSFVSLDLSRRAKRWVR
jgi:purine-cytosine permease-like protein